MNTEQPAAAGPGGESPTAAGRGVHRRRRHPFTVAVVAAAVLLAGSGSAWWASTASATGSTAGSGQMSGGLPDAAPAPQRPAPEEGAGDGAGEGAGGSASGTPAEPEASGPRQAVNSYTAEGRSLKVTFWGGVCGGYAASAEESSKRVTVSVRQKKTDRKQVCVKMARQQTVEVTLDAPLGGREVVDAADGEAMAEK